MSSQKNHFHHSVPIFYVSNFQASMDYYVGKLGFKKLWDWGTPPTFGAVGRDHVEIFLCEGGQGQPGTWISIFIDDVDTLHEEYKKSGAIIVNEPETYPWNMREMLVGDPDGHRLRMGHGIHDHDHPHDHDHGHDHEHDHH